MPFDKKTAKQAGKSSSRKGVPNKDVSKVRDALYKLLQDNSDNLEDWLSRVAKDDPKEAIKIFSSLTEYALPKLTRSDVDLTSSGEKINIPISEWAKKQK